MSQDAEAKLDDSLQTFLDENRPGHERMGAKAAEPAAREPMYVQPHEADAALANCALEHEVFEECITRGTMKERLLLCSAKKKAFWHCFQQQKLTLKALGYGEDDQTASANEEIKAHADRLYRDVMQKD